MGAMGENRPADGGVKDYDAYVASRRRFDPKAEVMSREAFFRRCQDERYGGKSMKSVRAERWRLVMVERPAWPGVFIACAVCRRFRGQWQLAIKHHWHFVFIDQS